MARLLKSLMSDRHVERRYITTGAQFGDAMSYSYLGVCVGFDSMLNKWENWELEYASRGYRTVPLDEFIELGGYGKNIEHLLGQKREESEEPIFHATRFKQNFYK